MRAICSIEGCGQPVEGRGLCNRHWKRWRKHGDPMVCLRDRVGDDPSLDVARFWRRVVRPHDDGCWAFMSRPNIDGYHRLSVRSRDVMAHRFAYELLVGPIPEGLTIDHLCRNRGCVNPAHLEPVTQGVNTLRGESPAAFHARKTHCIHGHEFTEENTIRRPDGNGRAWRRCRACQFARNHRRPTKSAQ